MLPILHTRQNCALGFGAPSFAYDWFRLHVVRRLFVPYGHMCGFLEAPLLSLLE